MPTQLKPLKDMLPRNAIRRGRVGFRVNNPVIDRDSVSIACERFMQKCGLPRHAFNDRFFPTADTAEQ